MKAYCPLFAKAHNGVETLCPEPFECAHCKHLGRYVEEMVAVGWKFTWECQGCLAVTKREILLRYAGDKSFDVEEFFPGFYNSSATDTEDGIIGGCERCGTESSFLQVTFRMGKDVDQLMFRYGDEKELDKLIDK